MDKSTLSSLYNGSDINEVWQASRHIPIIRHPQRGLISPNTYRAIHDGRACPYCESIMVFGSNFRKYSVSEARKAGYECQNSKGQVIINQAGTNPTIYFHRHYVSIDHKVNKARCPEKMFDYGNLEAVCWQCNIEKSDNNSYKLEQGIKAISRLADETLAELKLL